MRTDPLPPRFEFTHTWHVDVPAEVAYDVLADLASYPTWWRQVRSIARIDDSSARVVCRSALPYYLRFDLVRVREDRQAGVLEAQLIGDLDGWARWTIRSAQPGGGADLLYEQQVTTPGRLLRTTARVARPILVFNHGWMMRSGRRGLRRLLADASPARRRGRAPVLRRSL